MKTMCTSHTHTHIHTHIQQTHTHKTHTHIHTYIHTTANTPFNDMCVRLAQFCTTRVSPPVDSRWQPLRLIWVSLVHLDVTATTCVVVCVCVCECVCCVCVCVCVCVRSVLNQILTMCLTHTQITHTYTKHTTHTPQTHTHTRRNTHTHMATHHTHTYTHTHTHTHNTPASVTVRPQPSKHSERSWGNIWDTVNKELSVILEQ